MEPMWPLYLNNHERGSMPAGPSEAAFDFTAGMVTLCRDVRGALSTMAGRLLDVLSARSN